MKRKKPFWFGLPWGDVAILWWRWLQSLAVARKGENTPYFSSSEEKGGRQADEWRKVRKKEKREKERIRPLSLGKRIYVENRVNEKGRRYRIRLILRQFKKSRREWIGLRMNRQRDSEGCKENEGNEKRTKRETWNRSRKEKISLWKFIKLQKAQENRSKKTVAFKIFEEKRLKPCLIFFPKLLVEKN